MELRLAKIDQKIDKLDNHLDKIDDHLGSIDITLAKQEVNLEKHMERSDNLEEIVELLRADIKPLQKHVNAVDGILKFLGILSVVIALAAGIKSLLF